MIRKPLLVGIVVTTMSALCAAPASSQTSGEVASKSAGETGPAQPPSPKQELLEEPRAVRGFPGPRGSATSEDKAPSLAVPSEAGDGHPVGAGLGDGGTAPREEPGPDAARPLEGSSGKRQASRSQREVLEQAIEWSEAGLRSYARGELQQAHSRLSDARILLLAADLPQVMAQQGLRLLNVALPQEWSGYDLEAIYQELGEGRGSLPPHHLDNLDGLEDLTERGVIEREVRRILHRFGDTSPDAGYLAVFVQEVQTYVRLYQGRNRDFFERSFRRKHKYWPTIQATFTAQGIPAELGYIALVESGFNPKAYSTAAARGLWQFISSTGKSYGLSQSADFYDVAKATDAAAEYLLDLIGIFGPSSFLLATAAYNAGELRIMECLRQLEDPFEGRSFWEIRSCLPRETREYVPRIMAAAVIGADPSRFGFDLEPAETVMARYDVVRAPQVTPLSRIAQTAGISVAELRSANTDLPAGATATPCRNFPIYVPTGTGDSVSQALLATAEEDSKVARRADRPAESVSRRSSAPDSSQERRKAVTYVVRRGDALSTIAAKYGVDYRQLASWNQMGPPYRILVGQRLLIYPKAGAASRIVYTVQSGNTLARIAGIFAVDTRDIMGWNQLRSSRLIRGQKLVIHPVSTFDTRTYQVRRGDTVGTIARRYGVPVQSVLTANGLTTKSLIQPGQRLVVYVPG